MGKSGFCMAPNHGAYVSIDKYAGYDRMEVESLHRPTTDNIKDNKIYKEYIIKDWGVKLFWMQ
jgi:hypothetical protein